MKNTLQYEKYTTYVSKVPEMGRHILAYGTDDAIVVYQAYRHSIGKYALANQCFGGADYSYNRMSWIKTNFLWMMYRSGWGMKPGQEIVLAIWLRKSFFNSILKQAVYSSFQHDVYATVEDWKADLHTREVRLQWDPDHDPRGVPQARRAIQLGLKGSILKEFGQSQILRIEDMSEFVEEQREVIDRDQIDKLMVPKETIFIPDNSDVKTYLGA